jgi:(2S)-methylsuccinyl-CoA dehydrogenase
MAHRVDTDRPAGDAEAVIDELLATCRTALAAAEGLERAAHDSVASLVAPAGDIDSGRLDRNQFAAHGYAWLATYVEALRQMLGWGERLGALDGLEALILQAAFGEYLAQLGGGIAMSQVETARPADMALGDDTLAAFRAPATRRLVASGNTAAVRQAIAGDLARGGFGDTGLGDPTLALVQDQFRRFADDKVAPDAQDWHRADVLIPDEVIAEMAALGVFGLTAPEDDGGAGMGKVAMCLVTEELCRAHLGVGSLATRSEIAAELIRLHGTPAQSERWTRPITSGAVLPAALFTEPDVGSDLSAVKTRAVRDRDNYRIIGAKTWSTHAARADLMILLARTDPEKPGYKGLSMFLAPKPRGTVAAPFPAEGMSGSEIAVLGYRGMKEYEIAFDGFEVAADCLLGEVEGQGFKQLMGTMETARIQTAARGVGVARAALELGLAYARERRQFGREIFAFPRVSGKLAWMATECMIVRQLTWYAAREKDAGRRCDLEAGMAKLLAARVAWAAADNAVQIHGGNGYAEEYPVSRVLVDSRILNVFEGAAEIQAQVIARRLLART